MARRRKLRPGITWVLDRDGNPTGKVEVRIRDLHRKEHSRTFDTVDEAEAWQDEMRTAKRGRRHFVDPKIRPRSRSTRTPGPR